jgi:hypothetical protein
LDCAQALVLVAAEVGEVKKRLEEVAEIITASVGRNL